MLRSPLRAFIMEWHIGSGWLSPEARPTVSPGMYTHTHTDTHRHTEKASYKTTCWQPSHKSHLILSESVFSGFRYNKCKLKVLLPGVHVTFILSGHCPRISNISSLTIILFFFFFFFTNHDRSPVHLWTWYSCKYRQFNYTFLNH